nr:hypothetical protein [Tanacetum cinerariifolium]
MTLEGKKTWWLRIGAGVYDSWKLQGDVEELWDKLAKLGLGLRCCLVSMVPRLNLVPNEVMWRLGSQVESLRLIKQLLQELNPPKLKKPKKKSDSAISSEETPSKKKPNKVKKDVPSKKKPISKPKPTKKKAPVKDDRGKGLIVLSEVALSEAAQVKEALKKNKKDSHMLHASGSDDGVGDSGDDENNDDDSDEVTKDDDEDDVESDANEDKEASDNEKMDSEDDENLNVNQNDDEEEEHEEEYSFEFNDDEEEYNELYKDVDIKSLDAECEKERKGDAEMNDADKNVSQERLSEQVVDDAHVTLTTTQKTEADNEVASMMNANVRQEESSTLAPPLLTVPSYTAEFKKKTLAKKEKYIDIIKKSMTEIIKDEVKSQLPHILRKEISDFTTPVIQRTINESLENVVLAKSSQSTYEAATSLTEFDLKKILLDKLEKSKSYRAAKQHRDHYDELRGREDKDKDEDPPGGLDQGLKKRKTSKDDEPPKGSIPPQTWISKMAKAGKPLTTFDELKSTPIEFSAYVLHNLKIKNLTQEHLVGPAFNLLKGTYKSQVELKLQFKEYLTHVKAMKKYDYKYLDEIIVQREDHQLYKFIERDFPRLNLRDIEDMLLLLSCDGILSSIRRVLHDIASSLEMDYMPKRRWSNLDRKRSRIIIKAIDQQLFERRLIRNLEKFVGEREYINDFRLLERTI